MLAGLVRFARVSSRATSADGKDYNAKTAQK